jgi:hypothetical protein
MVLILLIAISLLANAILAFMISLYEFISLSLNEQADVLWKGSYLGDRIEDAITVQLFSISNFYAELYYDHCRNEIVRIRPFKSRELLDPYLQHFDIVHKLNE